MNGSSDIFALRREGRLEEALNLSRQSLSEKPGDPWVLRGYGWTVHSLLIKAQDEKQWDKMRELLEEFNGLDVPADDELLIAKRKEWPGRLPAADGSETVWQIRQSAKEASGAGNYQEALSIYREGLKSFPDDAGLSIGLGWETPRYLKELLVSDGDHAGAIRAALLDYARLNHIEKPGVLHSLVLLRAAQAAEKGEYPGFIKFFQWWDPAHLRPDDFNRMPSPDGARDYPGCVARVIKAIYRTSDQEKDADLLVWATGFVGEHFEKFPEEEWFPYYYGKLLLRSGGNLEARNKVIPIVRRKRSEFWVWSCLAETFIHDDPHLWLACLCRAMQCRVKDDSFRVNVHEKLGQLLCEQKQFAEARYEYAACLAIRRGKNWSLSDTLTRIEQAEWYVKAPILQNNQQLYKKYAGDADAIIMADLPEMRGVVSGFQPGSENKPARTFIAWRDEGMVRECPVKTKQFAELNDLKEGAPVYIRLDPDAKLQRVVSLRARDGRVWDIYPSRPGVVVQVNQKKRLSVLAIGEKDVVIVHHDSFPDAAIFRPGSVFQLGLRHDNRHNVWRPLYVSASGQRIETSWCRRYEGELDKREDQSFGFVRPDIFCSPDLIEGTGVTDGQRVKGMAVMEFNKKKGKYGWRALTLDF